MRALLLLVLLGAASVQAQTVRLVVPLDAARLDARVAAETGAVVLTGLGHLAAAEAGVSGAHIPLVTLGWGGCPGDDGAGVPGGPRLYRREPGPYGARRGTALGGAFARSTSATETSGPSARRTAGSARCSTSGSSTAIRGRS